MKSSIERYFRIAAGIVPIAAIGLVGANIAFAQTSTLPSRTTLGTVDPYLSGTITIQPTSMVSGDPSSDTEFRMSGSLLSVFPSRTKVGGIVSRSVSLNSTTLVSAAATSGIWSPSLPIAEGTADPVMRFPYAALETTLGDPGLFGILSKQYLYGSDIPQEFIDDVKISRLSVEFNHLTRTQLLAMATTYTSPGNPTVTSSIVGWPGTFTTEASLQQAIFEAVNALYFSGLNCPNCLGTYSGPPMTEEEYQWYKNNDPRLWRDRPVRYQEIDDAFKDVRIKDKIELGVPPKVSLETDASARTRTLHPEIVDKAREDAVKHYADRIKHLVQKIRDLLRDLMDAWFPGALDNYRDWWQDGMDNLH